MWTGSGQGQVESSCECGYEPSGSMRCWDCRWESQREEPLGRPRRGWADNIKMIF
jgi:hypothetical protein